MAIKRFILLTLIALGWATSSYSLSQFSDKFCQDDNYFCLQPLAHETWTKLFPSPQTRDLVQRINRMNVALRPGMRIAVPKNLDRLTLYDVSPFPRYINTLSEKTIYISQKNLAWAAYAKSGELLWWGPISSGADLCPGITGGCKTPAGAYRIINKQDSDCVSTAFPKRANGDNGGALMPYCMHFFQGYALHGSKELPGYRASHGCIRMFINDARWLNETFITLPDNDIKGTRVIIDER